VERLIAKPHFGNRRGHGSASCAAERSLSGISPAEWLSPPEGGVFLDLPKDRGLHFFAKEQDQLPLASIAAISGEIAFTANIASENVIKSEREKHVSQWFLKRSSASKVASNCQTTFFYEML